MHAQDVGFPPRRLAIRRPCKSPLHRVENISTKPNMRAMGDVAALRYRSAAVRLRLLCDMVL